MIANKMYLILKNLAVYCDLIINLQKYSWVILLHTRLSVFVALLLTIHPHLTDFIKVNFKYIPKTER